MMWAWVIGALSGAAVVNQSAIALFLRVGLDGIGWDAYEEHFWEQRIVRFE